MTTAARIAEHIFKQGQATVERPDDIRAWIKAMIYRPVYADRGA
jgi:malate dehydrogenase (oxaloacetate-decarboxylating)(NADP+)